MQESIEFVNRRGTDSAKWDDLSGLFSRDDLQPMWVADMDFRSPRCVFAAIEEYLKTGVVGYYNPRDSYDQAFIDWERKYHGYEVQREWLRFSPGVVPAFNWLVQILTAPGDSVLVQPPVYYPFFHAAQNNGRKLVRSSLINDHGIYSVDFADFEQRIIQENVKLFILCSPHNPISRVWRREELRTMLDICKKHGVYVISDEIHHDLTFGGSVHIPSASAGEPSEYDDILVTLTANTKTFNLAGFQNSFVIIPCKAIRDKFDAFVNGIHILSGSPFGYIAVEAAYRHGRPWLEQVKEIIYGNYLYARETLQNALPDIVVSPLEGTYLMWIDLGAYLSADTLKDIMENKCRLALDYGEWFGGEMCATHIRMNLATSRELVETAVSRIIEHLK